MVLAKVVEKVSEPARPKPSQIQPIDSFGGPPETRTRDPLIKSQVHSEPERNIDKKAQLFRGSLGFFFGNGRCMFCPVQAQTSTAEAQDLMDRASERRSVTMTDQSQGTRRYRRWRVNLTEEIQPLNLN